MGWSIEQSAMSRFKLKTRFKLAVVLLSLVVVFSIGGGLGYAFFFGGTSINLQKGLVGYWDFGDGSTTSAQRQMAQLLLGIGIMLSAHIAEASPPFMSMVFQAEQTPEEELLIQTLWIF